MLNPLKRKILFWLSVLIFLALVPVTILYSLGWRLDDAWNLKRTGGLYVAADISGTEIFMDGELQKRTNLLQSGTFVDNLAPGKYRVAVLHENYLPWTKELKVFSQLVSEARALLVPRSTNGKVVLKGPFKEIKASFGEGLILLTEVREKRTFVHSYSPLEEKILKSELKQETEEEILRERLDSRESSKIVWDGAAKTLKASWLKETPFPYYFPAPEETLLAGKEVRNFEYFPKRRDVAIAAFDNGIWTVEFDSRGGRIIQPIYKGKSPYFVLFPGENQLYILDDGILIKASLFSQG